MSLNSLVNFGVPGQGGERAPILQPTFSNRFRVVFYNFGGIGDNAPYELTRAVKKVTRPSPTFSEESVKSYLSTVYLATRVEWETMSMELHDDIDNEVMSRVQQQLAKQQNMYDQTASRAGQNYKFEMDIDVLAGGATAGDSSNDPNVLQKIQVVGAFVMKSEFSEQNYGEANFGQVSLTIRFDNAIFFDENGQRLGTFSHSPEINGRLGSVVTGIGSIA